MALQKWQVSTDALTGRSVDILRLLNDGLSDREIAERLVMTINTVKWYNRQIYSALGVSSRTQAIVRARELRLLEHESEHQSTLTRTAHVYTNSLPMENTRFIGRKHEILACKTLLETARLLTLVGPPGTGKTRLALQLVRTIAADFKDGVYFVSLAQITDPAMVALAIADTLDVKEVQGEAILETIKRVLRHQQVLLVLDNFEHLLREAPLVSELLSASLDLKVLATSREPLHLYGEQEYMVRPLELPHAEQSDPQTLLGCESVALFCQHARAAQADFEVNASNALDVAKICIRLEGLPLAIELAAARVKLLPPHALLGRLDNRLSVLAGNVRDLPPRQRTLRQTIDWSYNLLNEDERRLFARLSVFRGTYTFDAVEAVCGDGLSADVFDVLTSLVDKSLIQSEFSAPDQPRFLMLETIHEYAAECLSDSGEHEPIGKRHATYFLKLAEMAEPELRQSGFSYWMQQLEIEHYNLLIALESSLGGGDTEVGLRLVAALRDYWIMSAHFIEGQQWAQRALQKVDGAAVDLRLRIATTAAFLDFYLGEKNGRAFGKALLRDAVELAPHSNSALTTAWAQIILGALSIGQADEYRQAVRVVEQGLDLFRKHENKPGMAQALCIIGELSRTYGDDERAKQVYEECLELVRQTGEKRRESMTLSNLGFIATHLGDVEQAQALFAESLIQLLDIRYDKHLIVSTVVAQVATIAAKGDPQRAARLIGAADAWFERMGTNLQPGNRPEHERNLAFVRSKLSPEAFEHCWNEGRTMSLEQMVASVIQVNNA